MKYEKKELKLSTKIEIKGNIERFYYIKAYSR